MKKYLILSIFAIAHMAHAVAPLAWGREKVQAATKSLSRWPKEAVRVVKKKYIDKGTLSAQEQRVLNQLRVGTISAIVAALAAATGVYIASRDDQEAPLEITASSGTTATDVGSILSKFKVSLGQDDSPPALFIKAVTNGASQMVKSLYDLVDLKVLKAGMEIAAQRVPSARAIYGPIANTINRAITAFSPSQLKKNLMFIRNATTGLFDEVKQNICVDRIKPSENAIAEALEQLKKKTGKTFESIKGFVQNPKCFLRR